MPRIGTSRIVLKRGYEPPSAIIYGSSRRVSEVIDFMKRKKIPVKPGMGTETHKEVCRRFGIKHVDVEDAIAFYQQNKRAFDAN